MRRIVDWGGGVKSQEGKDKRFKKDNRNGFFDPSGAGAGPGFLVQIGIRSDPKSTSWAETIG